MGDDLETSVLGEVEAFASRLDGVSSVRVARNVLVDRLDTDLRSERSSDSRAYTSRRIGRTSSRVQPYRSMELRSKSVFERVRGGIRRT